MGYRAAQTASGAFLRRRTPDSLKTTAVVAQKGWARARGGVGVAETAAGVGVQSTNLIYPRQPG